MLTISGKTHPASGDLPQGVAFVQKPIGNQALVERVRELVAPAMPLAGMI